MWLESHQSILTHRKTGRLMRHLGINRMEAVGHIHALWYWCFDNAPTGDLSHVDVEDIATACYWDKDPDRFLSAMIAAGWVDEDLQVHEWMDGPGRILARLKADAARKRAARLHLPSPTTGKPTAPVKPKVKRVVEEDSDFEPFFADFWAAYPARATDRGVAVKLEKGKTRAWLLQHIPQEERERLLQCVRNYRDSGQIPKDPLRFLADNYWKEWDQPHTRLPLPPGGRKGGHNGAPPPTGPNADNYKTGGKYAHLFNRSTARVEDEAEAI